MKCFLLFFVFATACLNAHVQFRAADAFEKEVIQNAMVAFYTQQLMQAGLFENEERAKEAAGTEVCQEPLEGKQFVHLLVSEDETTQYGYFVYSLTDQTAYLDAIYLEADHQGKGLGKQVLDDFEALFLETDVHTIKLYVFDHNKRAVGLYSKIGYEIETTYFVGSKPIGHHMKKRLVKLI